MATLTTVTVRMTVNGKLVWPGTTTHTGVSWYAPMSHPSDGSDIIDVDGRVVDEPNAIGEGDHGQTRGTGGQGDAGL